MMQGVGHEKREGSGKSYWNAAFSIFDFRTIIRGRQYEEIFKEKMK